MKKLPTLRFALAISVSMSSLVLAQDKMGDEKKMDKKDDSKARKTTKDKKQKDGSRTSTHG